MAKKKPAKRKRSPGKQLERDRKRANHFTANHPKNSTIVLDEYPGLFDRVPSNGQVVRARAEAHFPGITKGNLGNLTRAPEDGIHIVKLKDEDLRKLPSDHPVVSCIRTAAGLIPQHAQDQIFEAWDRLQRIETVTWNEKKGANRSSTKALHCGIWHLNQRAPFTTKDTRQECPTARKSLEELLRLIQVYVAPVIKRLIMIYSPNLWAKQQRAHDYVQATVNDLLEQYHIVDFGGAFFTVAIKEGSSESPHIDFNDHPRSLTWVVPFGPEPWTGGDFVAPQTKEYIPIGQGQLLGAMTRRLLHSGTKISGGRRLVLTCFTDNTLIKNSELYHGMA